nr:YggS family pyridoxal phosphate-dependent enzyme [bacterium]
MTRQQEIKARYEEIMGRITGAAARSGRAAGDITLLGATKRVAAEDVVYACSLGMPVAGENRVQEWQEKYGILGDRVVWDFIGQLQANKVKYILGKVRLIHSLDRLPLAEEIQRLASLHGLVADVLVQVNLAGEATKGGVAPGELPYFIEQLAGYPAIRICGLMAVPPVPSSEGEGRRNLAAIRALFDDCARRGVPGDGGMRVLSMGMSRDFEWAIEEGATLVRVGEALFGRRIDVKEAPKHGE